MYRGRMYCRSGGLHSGFSPEAKTGSSSALFVPICFWRECGYGFDREMGLVLHWDDVWCGPSEQEEFSAYISEAPRKEFGRVSQQPILISSRDSRIPPRRPSMIGRIPILGCEFFMIVRFKILSVFVSFMNFVSWKSVGRLLRSGSIGGSSCLPGRIGPDAFHLPGVERKYFGTVACGADRDSLAVVPLGIGSQRNALPVVDENFDDASVDEHPQFQFFSFGE